MHAPTAWLWWPDTQIRTACALCHRFNVPEEAPFLAVLKYAAEEVSLHGCSEPAQITASSRVVGASDAQMVLKPWC